MTQPYAINKTLILLHKIIESANSIWSESKNIDNWQPDQPNSKPQKQNYNEKKRDKTFKHKHCWVHEYELRSITHYQIFKPFQHASDYKHKPMCPCVHTVK